MSLLVTRTFSDFRQAHQYIPLCTVRVPAQDIVSVPNEPNGNLLGA